MTSPALAQDLPANPGYSARLLQRAMAGYSDSTSSRSNVAANIAEALIRFRRCGEAMDFTPEGRVTEDFWLTRLFAASVATDQRPCRDHFATQRLRLYERAEFGDRHDHAVARGALLRLLGREEEGIALVRGAEAASETAGGPRTRLSRLWFLRWTALRIYAGTELFDAELDRTVAEFLASPPATARGHAIAGMFVEYLRERGDMGRAAELDNATCWHNSDDAQLCGSQASRADSERGVIGAGVRDFMLRVGEVESLAARGSAEAALAEARLALRVRVPRAEFSPPYLLAVRALLFRKLAFVIAAFGVDDDLALLVREARPTGGEWDDFRASLAAGYARRGDQGRAATEIAGIRDRRVRRQAWMVIATATPLIAMEIRKGALAMALGIPEIPIQPSSPPAGHGPGVFRLAGGGLIASETRSLEDVLYFARISRDLAPGRSEAGHTEFLYDAFDGARDDGLRAQIAAELVSRITHPCAGGYGCRDTLLLHRLGAYGLEREAEALLSRFEDGGISETAQLALLLAPALP